MLMFLLFCQGTWQFRSALSLMYPWKPYRRSDDIESFIHVYLYLVVKYQITDVTSLQELVTTFFEGVSLVHGFKVGGDQKRYFFIASELPFKLPYNPALQELLDTMVALCSHSYKSINVNEMRDRYGFGSLSARLPQKTTAAPQTDVVDPPSDDDDFPDDDDMLRPMGAVDLKSDKMAPAANKDPCVVEGFLSEVGDLTDLLKQHAVLRLSTSDKDPDQFLARRHEDVRRGPNKAGTSHIGTLSVTGTKLSSSSGAMLGGSHPGSNRGGTPSDSRKRMRIASAAKAGGAVARNEQGPSNSVHRDKRIK